MISVLKVNVEWDEGKNVEQMWEQVKRAMVESCSVRIGGKYPKNVCWNEVLGARDEIAKYRCMEV